MENLIFGLLLFLKRCNPLTIVSCFKYIVILIMIMDMSQSPLRCLIILCHDSQLGGDTSSVGKL